MVRQKDMGIPLQNIVTDKPSTTQTQAWYAVGQGFLPSVKELNIWAQNKEAVNAALQQINAVKLNDDSYWSSTGTSVNNAWLVAMDYGTRHNMPPYLGYSVRAVVKY